LTIIRIICVVYGSFEKLIANRGQFNMSIEIGRNKSFRFIMTIDKL